jgi:hypothetical protein
MQSDLLFIAIHSTSFGRLLRPSSGYNETVITVIGTFLVSVWCGLNPLKGVQGRESIDTDTRNVPMTVTTV